MASIEMMSLSFTISNSAYSVGRRPCARGVGAGAHAHTEDSAGIRGFAQIVKRDSWLHCAVWELHDSVDARPVLLAAERDAHGTAHGLAARWNAAESQLQLWLSRLSGSTSFGKDAAGTRPCVELDEGAAAIDGSVQGALASTRQLV